MISDNVANDSSKYHGHAITATGGSSPRLAGAHATSNAASLDVHGTGAGRRGGSSYDPVIAIDGVALLVVLLLLSLKSGQAIERMEGGL